ncbi:hypothetical protein FRC06_000747, partial [Ceratobasidium sp. 370]
MEVDASMSAIDVSREWVGARSPTRSQAGAAAGAGDIPLQGEHELLRASFPGEFEGPQAETEDGERPTRATSVGPFPDDNEGVVEESNMERTPVGKNPPPEPEQNGKTGRDSSSPEPIPPQDPSQDLLNSPVSHGISYLTDLFYIVT